MAERTRISGLGKVIRPLAVMGLAMAASMGSACDDDPNTLRAVPARAAPRVAQVRAAAAARAAPPARAEPTAAEASRQPAARRARLAKAVPVAQQEELRAKAAPEAPERVTSRSEVAGFRGRTAPG
jgi:hypothetical protein